jgi:hypothetical protein
MNNRAACGRHNSAGTARPGSCYLFSVFCGVQGKIKGKGPLAETENRKQSSLIMKIPGGAGLRARLIPGGQGRPPHLLKFCATKGPFTERFILRRTGETPVPPENVRLLANR